MKHSDILIELDEAESSWKELLKRSTEKIEKPVILNIGPRPKFIKYRQPRLKEPKYPIFPLPNIEKSRGGLINRKKKQLAESTAELVFTSDKTI